MNSPIGISKINQISDQRDDGLAIYNYLDKESKIDILRYKQACKKNQKLYRDIFNRYAGDTTRQRNNVVKTFDLVGAQSRIISGINLGKMVKDFSLCINPYFHRNLREVQAEIPILIKLVNEKVMGM